MAFHGAIQLNQPTYIRYGARMLTISAHLARSRRQFSLVSWVVTSGITQPTNPLGVIGIGRSFGPCTYDAALYDRRSQRRLDVAWRPAVIEALICQAYRYLAIKSVVVSPAIVGPMV